MKQWIREHPWRLEIVPFLMVMIAIIAPLVYRHYVLAGPSAVRVTPQQWLMGNASIVANVAAMWFVKMHMDHEWVRNERRAKSFNRWTAVYCAMIAATGLFSAWLRFSGTGRAYTTWVFLWGTLGFVSFLVQWVIEYSRPFVPTEREPAPAADSSVMGVQPGDSFYFREVHIRWAWLAYAFLMGMWTMSLNLSDRWWWGSAVSAIVLPLYALFSLYVVFVVSKERITVRIGRRKVAIPMQEVQRCSIVDVPIGSVGWSWDPVKSYYGMPLYGSGMKAGYMLQIDTTVSKSYILAMNNPHTACALINSALAARTNA
jgi:hypothetical protein